MLVTVWPRRLRATACVAMLSLLGFPGTASAQAGTAQQAVKAARATLRSLDQAIAAGRSVDDLRALLSRRSRQLAGYQNELSPAQLAVLRRLHAANSLLRTQVATAQRSADTALVSLRVQSFFSVANNAPRNWIQEVLDEFKELTFQMTKDLGCELVFDSLLGTDLTHAVPRRAGEKLPQALMDAAAERLAQQFGPGPWLQRIRWASWADGLFENANQLLAAAPTGPVFVNGHVHSRALYYYIKACQVSPGSRK